MMNEQSNHAETLSKENSTSESKNQSWKAKKQTQAWGCKMDGWEHNGNVITWKNTFSSSHLQ